jgi:hypothetical protein
VSGERWDAQYEETAVRLHAAGDYLAADDIRTLVDGLKQHEAELEQVKKERDEALSAPSIVTLIERLTAERNTALAERDRLAEALRVINKWDRPHAELNRIAADALASMEGDR